MHIIDILPVVIVLQRMFSSVFVYRTNTVIALFYHILSLEPAEGKKSPAEMANIFLGMNEPDIQGSCMGNMFGTCVRQGSMKIITNPCCIISHHFDPLAMSRPQPGRVRHKQCNRMIALSQTTVLA